MHTVNITNDIARHRVLQVDFHQTLFFRKVLVCAEDDLPHVSFGQRLPVLEPLDHFLHELVRDAVFPVRERQFGTGIGLLDVAPTYVPISSDVSRFNWYCTPSVIIS